MSRPLHLRFSETRESYFKGRYFMLNKVKVGIVIAAVLSLLVVKLKLKTKGGAWMPGSWMFTFMFVLMLPALMFAQGYDKTRGRPEAEKVSDAKIEIQIDRVTASFGAFLNQPNFSTNMLFGSIQLHGVGLPFIREGASTGVAFEGHITKIFTENIGNVTIQSFETVDWRVWSITRIPLGVIPIKALKSGTPARMFLIADVLVAEGGPVDWTDEFSVRAGFGGDLGVIGPGNLVIEVYTFQRGIPIAVTLGYGF